jgi:uncharacterized membrane protein (UPF0127 family)
MAGTRTVNILLRETEQPFIEAARWCDSWMCKLRGLQFRRRLNPGEALILVGGSDSTTGSSIHMLFVFFPIAAIWINSAGVVTHTVLAKPWRLFYGSKKPARYVVECEPGLLDAVQPGDKIKFQFLEEEEIR